MAITINPHVNTSPTNGNSNNLSNQIITILVPNDESFRADNTSPELITNNIKCFTALKNQTEPLIVFIKKLGKSKPLSQIAIRLRHLESEGEGDSFFAFGYPTLYSEDDINVLLTLSSEMYKLNENGTITKIAYNGQDVNVMMLNNLIGSYNHSVTNISGNTLGTVYLPKIYYENGIFYIKSLFGSSVRNVNAELDYDIYYNLLIIKGGWQHPKFGNISNDILFKIDLETNTLTTVDETITVGESTITGYTLTKM